MEDKYKIPFINACIRSFSERFKLSLSAAFLYLERFKGVIFLNDFYDVEHLQSIDDTVDDLVAVCKKNGGLLE